MDAVIGVPRQDELVPGEGRGEGVPFQAGQPERFGMALLPDITVGGGQEAAGPAGRVDYPGSGCRHQELHYHGRYIGRGEKLPLAGPLRPAGQGLVGGADQLLLAVVCRRQPIQFVGYVVQIAGSELYFLIGIEGCWASGFYGGEAVRDPVRFQGSVRVVKAAEQQPQQVPGVPAGFCG